MLFPSHDLMKKHSGEKIIDAVEKCLNWTTRKSDMAAMQHILDPKTRWDKRQSQESIERNNMDYLQEISYLDDRVVGNGLKICVGKRFFELNSTMKTRRVEVTDPQMKEQIEELLKCFPEDLRDWCRGGH